MFDLFIYMQVLQLLPVAHKYNISSVLDDCMFHAKNIPYNSETAVKFIEIAARLQASMLASQRLEWKTGKTMQAAKNYLHQLRKRDRLA